MSAQPYTVAGSASWSDVAHDIEVRASFDSEDAARSFARSLHLPIVDVIRHDLNRAGRIHGGRVIAARRMVAHPGMPAMPLTDTIGGAA